MRHYFPFVAILLGGEGEGDRGSSLELMRRAIVVDDFGVKVEGDVL